MKTLFVICADPAHSSCIVNAIYEDYEEAEKWVSKENEIAGFELYWVESCDTYVKKLKKPEFSYHARRGTKIYTKINR